MNNFNLFLTIYLGQINQLAEEINSKLLNIKIIEESKSLRGKVIIWMNQFAREIKNILAFTHKGIKEFKKIETGLKHRQLQLKL